MRFGEGVSIRLQRCIDPINSKENSVWQVSSNFLCSNTIYCLSSPLRHSRFILLVRTAAQQGKSGSFLSIGHSRFILLVRASAQQGKSGSILSIGQVLSASTVPLALPITTASGYPGGSGCERARRCSLCQLLHQRAKERMHGCARSCVLASVAAAAAYASAHACLFNQINEWGIYLVEYIHIYCLAGVRPCECKVCPC
jgi:hypothetical protein